MISIIVPAHNEQDFIGECVRSLSVAASHPSFEGEALDIIVVLDACRAATAERARESGASTIDSAAHNMGIARSLGARSALDKGARWLAFIDADTQVAPDWLDMQIAVRADAVCGTIGIDDWGPYGERMRRHFSLTYFDREGHSHVHGANLGVSAAAYEGAGGYPPLETGEDVALVNALRESGAIIAWSRAPRVTTKARASFKAPGGLGATLLRIEASRQWAGAPLAAAP